MRLSPSELRMLQPLSRKVAIIDIGDLIHCTVFVSQGGSLCNILSSVLQVVGDRAEHFQRMTKGRRSPPRALQWLSMNRCSTLTACRAVSSPRPQQPFWCLQLICNSQNIFDVCGLHRITSREGRSLTVAIMAFDALSRRCLRSWLDGQLVLDLNLNTSLVHSRQFAT